MIKDRNAVIRKVLFVLGFAAVSFIINSCNLFGNQWQLSFTGDYSGTGTMSVSHTGTIYLLGVKIEEYNGAANTGGSSYDAFMLIYESGDVSINLDQEGDDGSSYISLDGTLDSSGNSMAGSYQGLGAYELGAAKSFGDGTFSAEK